MASELNFAMLACATNLFQCLVLSLAVGRAADRYLSAPWPLRLGLDRGCSSADRYFANACPRDSATKSGGAGAAVARHAVARVCAGLSLRDSLVRRDLLLDLRHYAPLRRYADSGGRRHFDSILHVCRALSRPVRTAAGSGGRIRYYRSQT